MSALGDQLQQKIADRSAHIGIIGLGYVGLPLALAFAERAFKVTGFDVDNSKIERIHAGKSYFRHLSEDRLNQVVKSGYLHASSDFSQLAEVDAVLICVPTPLTEHRDPDMRYVEGTAYVVAERLHPGQLVVLESTTYPGTTDTLVRGILEEASGLCAGKDFFLAFSPEREDPGNPKFGTTSIPKVIGGDDPIAGDLAEALYSQVIERTVRVSASRVAEATKLTENIFRAVNIALVNELKVIYDRMGIDIWEVLDASATKPFGFMRFNPGPGWGGHCIPLDPFYLTWKAREYGLSTRFIELAGEVNVGMPSFVVNKLQLALNERAKSVKNSKVLVLGLAYKKDIDDPRESPAFEIIDRLLHLGAEVKYHDPHIAKSPSMRTWPELPPMQSQALEQDLLANTDAVIVVTDHSDVDYDFVAKHASLVIDTRGVYRQAMPNLVRA